MKSAEEFLKRVLPSQGNYCVAAFSKTRNGPKHLWCRTVAELAKAIEAYDLANDAVYHACASYGDKKNKRGKTARTKENVQWLRSLYCEIDVRDDKGYQTKAEAIEALTVFLETTKLPIPIIVDSGGGYHLYWPLDKDLDRATWERYANGLQKLATSRGFKIDTGIGTDAARILRTPGTTNRKYGNTIVTLCNDVEPYPISAFTILAFQNPQPVVKKFETVLADANAIASKCRQLRTLRDSPSGQSGLAWIATGRILAQCVDGEKLWHEWSARDERYNDTEANAKWEDSVRFNNGVTCAYFGTVNPEGCEGCPFSGKIKTPLTLGRPQKYKIPEEVGNVLDAIDLPKGFKFSANGQLLFVSEKKSVDGDVQEDVTFVHEFPLLVIDRSVSEVSGQDCKITFLHWQPHDGWQELLVDAADFLRSSEVAFGGKGIFGTDDKLLKKYVKQCLNMLAQRQAKNMSYETFGWKNNESAFLLGNRMYSTVKDDAGNVSIHIETVGLTDTAARMAEHLQPGGSRKRGALAAWRVAAQKLFGPGMEWQASTVLASFAAPLMPLSLRSEGGLAWSTCDYKGGKGKSFATSAAASVWGDPDGVSTTSSDTAKSRIAVLGTLRHLPLAFDEMNRADPELAKEFLQIFTTGKEGTRLKQDGNLQNHQRNWCTILLTSSNSELIGAIEASAGSKAMGSRVFEVQATQLPLDKKELKESSKRGFVENCGHAGHVYIQTLVYLNAIGALETMLDDAEQFLDGLYEFGTEDRFKVAFYKAVYVASQILVEMEMLSFSPERIIDWLVKEDNKEDEHAWRTSNNMVDVLGQYLREKLQSTLVVPMPWNYKPLHVVKAPTAELAIRIEETGNIFIDKLALGKWLQTKEVSMRHLVKDLNSRQIIKEKHARRSLGAGTGYGAGQAWVLVINGKHPDIANLIAPEDNVVDMQQAKTLLRR